MSDVIHQPEQQRFILPLTDTEYAILEYQLTGSDINFHHTFVPAAGRGKGAAEKLVRAGLQWARQQQFSIEASCSYVQKFLFKNGKEII